MSAGSIHAASLVSWWSGVGLPRSAVAWKHTANSWPEPVGQSTGVSFG
jgi:hypothetical protein